MVILGPLDLVLNFTTVYFKLIHSCQMEKRKSCIAKEINNEQMIHLLVQSDPVTFRHVTMIGNSPGNSDSTRNRYWLKKHYSSPVALLSFPSK